MVLRAIPVSVWVAVTSTPGSTAPLASFTVPLICAVDCAQPLPVTAINTSSTKTKNLTISFIAPPPINQQAKLLPLRRESQTTLHEKTGLERRNTVRSPEASVSHIRRRRYERCMQDIATPSVAFIARARHRATCVRAGRQTQNRGTRNQSCDAASFGSEAFCGLLPRAFRNAGHEPARDDRAQSSNWKRTAISGTFFSAQCAKHQSHLSGSREFQYRSRQSCLAPARHHGR